MIDQLQAPTAARERTLFPAGTSVTAALRLRDLDSNCLTKRLLSPHSNPQRRHKIALDTQALQIDHRVPPELLIRWLLRL